MKKFILIPFILFFAGCANMASTKLKFESDKSVLIVEIPKEIDAKKLRIVYDSQQGTFEITSDSWVSTNQGTLTAQSSREKAFLESSSVLIEKATEGAVRGAMKGVVP